MGSASYEFPHAFIFLLRSELPIFFLSLWIIRRVLLKIKNGSHSESFHGAGFKSWKELHRKNRSMGLEQ